MAIKSIVVIAFSGSVVGAHAQDFALELVPSVTVLEVTGAETTITMSVYGQSNFGTHMLGGAFGLDVLVGADHVLDITWGFADWSSFNTFSGYNNAAGSYESVIFGQLVIPPVFPPAPGSELGGLIGSFTVVLDGLSPFFTFQLTEGDPFSLQTVTADTGTLYQNQMGEIELGSVVYDIPAPGALALFGSFGLIVSRRRR